MQIWIFRVILYKKLKRGIKQAEWLQSLRPIQFEDTEFMCTTYYDEWLTRAYGNYMKLPPEEQRKGQHGVTKWRF